MRRLEINFGDTEDTIVLRMETGRVEVSLGKDGFEAVSEGTARVLEWCKRHPGIEPRSGFIRSMAPEWGIAENLIKPVAWLVEAHFERLHLVRSVTERAAQAAEDNVVGSAR